jgi:preprotein translocase subunit SecY
VVGRKQYGGQSTFLPVKVNMASVLPIIFASALLSVPATVEAFVKVKEGGFWSGLFSIFDTGSWSYALLYFLLIIAFSYFYVAIQYNPIEMANQLQKNNGGVPGIRPGDKTREYIDHVLTRLTLWGGIYISVISVLPMLLIAQFNVPFYFGGTSLLILVGVAIDFMGQVESHLISQQYGSLMGKANRG